MEKWSPTKPFAGRYRRIINHGGRPYWCMFDYAVSPLPDYDGIEIELAAGDDSESERWFPHIFRGMTRCCDEYRRRSRELIGLRVEVRKVYTHPTATTEWGCESYGFSFIHELFVYGERMSG